MWAGGALAATVHETRQGLIEQVWICILKYRYVSKSSRLLQKMVDVPQLRLTNEERENNLSHVIILGSIFHQTHGIET